MKIHVMVPQVYLPSVNYARKELAKCACMAALSRERLIAFEVAGEVVSCFESAYPSVTIDPTPSPSVATGPMFSVGTPVTISGGSSIGLPSELEVLPFSEAEAMLSRLLNFKPFPHESVLEHGNFSVTFRISRVATHELVRHRLGGITQSSTRYIGYNLRDVVYLIKPMGAPDRLLGQYDEDSACYYADDWVMQMFSTMNSYRKLIEIEKWKREDARYNLAHALAAWIGYTTNFRQWRHMVSLRDHKKAAPEMQFIFGQIREYLGLVSPILLENMEGAGDGQRTAAHGND